MRVDGERCECGHRIEDHDGFGCLLVGECRCTVDVFTLRGEGDDDNVG